MRTVSSACSGGNRITEFRLVKVEDTYYIIWCQDFYGASIGVAKTQRKTGCIMSITTCQ